MSCKFTVTFNGDLNTAFSLAKAEAAKIKAKFDGNAQKGSFHVDSAVGEFEGTYWVERNEITFDLSKKPFFAPCSLIQSKLEEWIKKYEKDQGDQIA